MNKENQSNTDERIRKLNQQYAEMQVELVRLSKENAGLLNVTNKLVDKLAKLQKENAEQYKKTEKRVDEIVLQQKNSRKETNRTEQVFSQTADQLTESEIWEAEVAAEITAEILEENRKMIRETTDYTEVIARRFIGRILEKRFDADYMGQLKLQCYREKLYLDVDAWGASRSDTGAAYIVKIDLKFFDHHIEELEFRGSKFSLNHSVTKESSCSSLIVTASSCRLTTKNSAITASIACMIWSAWLPSELRNCSTVP